MSSGYLMALAVAGLVAVCASGAAHDDSSLLYPGTLAASGAIVVPMYSFADHARGYILAQHNPAPLLIAVVVTTTELQEPPVALISDPLPHAMAVLHVRGTLEDLASCIQIDDSETLQALLDDESKPHRLLIDHRLLLAEDGETEVDHVPLGHAVRHNAMKCTKVLLSRGAAVDCRGLARVTIVRLPGEKVQPPSTGIHTSVRPLSQVHAAVIA